MRVLKTETLEGLKSFPDNDALLGLLPRAAPVEADAFFRQLMQESFALFGTVSKSNAANDILKIIEETIPKELAANPFFDFWINDMAQISTLFCTIQDSEKIGFWLGSQRGYRRYHVDNVPLRMLVTYAGKGTEWLPEFAADRQAFLDGRSNEYILKDASALQYMKEWDVAVFKGGPEGLLHRTPDDAMSNPSILMRLDHAFFWEKILKHQQQFEQLAS